MFWFRLTDKNERWETTVVKMNRLYVNMQVKFIYHRPKMYSVVRTRLNTTGITFTLHPKNSKISIRGTHQNQPKTQRKEKKTFLNRKAFSFSLRHRHNIKVHALVSHGKQIRRIHISLSLFLFRYSRPLLDRWTVCMYRSQREIIDQGNLCNLDRLHCKFMRLSRRKRPYLSII